jgi:hypothetical protein
VICFTDRELQKAWREHRQAANVVSVTNSHRLLLFYSVECGLKAVFLKRYNYTRTDEWDNLKFIQHNINRLLDELLAGRTLKLPDNIQMDASDTEGDDRVVHNSKINEMWRYGGCCKQNQDSELEQKLVDILNWIETELGQL